MEGYCTCNTTAQQNTKLAITVVTKSSISDFRTWEHLERGGTSKRLTQNTRNSYEAWKILCMQYY